MSAPSEARIRLTGAELLAAAATSFLSAAILASYLADLLRLPLVPAAILPIAIGAGVVPIVWWRGRIDWRAADLIAWIVCVGGVFAWLLWLAWPALLPLGGGPDLAHHLALIDYIDRQRHLPHDPSLGAYLGEMIDPRKILFVRFR